MGSPTPSGRRASSCCHISGETIEGLNSSLGWNLEGSLRKLGDLGVCSLYNYQKVFKCCRDKKVPRTVKK